MNALRLLNLNIWNYNEPWPIRRGLIAGLIARTRPDVVALQEVRYQSWLDHRHQADQILDELKDDYHIIWQPAAYWALDEGDQWEGLAVLSRYPIVDQATVRLERDLTDPRDSFVRRVLGARVRVGDAHLWVFDTHYPLSERARARVAPITLDFVRRTAGDCPFVLSGDFNARPDELPIQFLTGQAEIDGARGDLVDAWTACHPGDAGHTFSAWERFQRIDYVFAGPGVEVPEIEIVGQTPAREITSPSDHCGLLATVCF